MSETPEAKKHLDEMTCLLYIERQLDRARGMEVSAHTQECEACRTLMHTLERETRLLTRAMLEEDEVLPSRLAEFQERARKSMQWIWGLVFGLAATGVYALYTGYIQPWQQQLEQAGFGGSNLLGLLIFQGAFWKGWQSMLTLLEVLAMLTLAGLGAAFFRRRIRRGSALALVVAGICATLALPAPAGATEFRKGDSVEIQKSEEIKGDVYISCGRAHVDGTIDGDLFFFGQSLDVNGHVTGDVITFAQGVRIRGQVDGNVRAFDNNMTITGTVGRNVTDFAEVLNIDSNARIGRSLTSFVESLNLDGSVGRDMLIMFERAVLSGKVEGGVQARGDSLVIGSNAVISGPVKFKGNKQPEVSSSAKLVSPVEFTQIEHKREYLTTHYFIWRIIWTAAFILFGSVLFLLTPRFGSETIAEAEHFGKPIAVGVLILFGIPLAAIIAGFTVVGIPLGVLALGFWFLMLCCAELVVGGVVGNWILGRGNSTWEIIGRVALGFVIVRIVYTPLAHIPVAGVLGALGIWMWGMGAISLALYRRFQPENGPITPSANFQPPIPPNATIGAGS